MISKWLFFFVVFFFHWVIYLHFFFFFLTTFNIKSDNHYELMLSGCDFLLNCSVIQLFVRQIRIYALFHFGVIFNIVKIIRLIFIFINIIAILSSLPTERDVIGITELVFYSKKFDIKSK